MADSDRLADLMLEWERLRGEDRAPTAEELCGGDAELVEELKRRIAIIEKAERVLDVDSSHTEPWSRATDAATPRAAGEIAPVTIDGYDVEQLLGRGGMGVVYRARHRELNRLVAVKVLDRSLMTTRQLERFREEARAIARLHHRNIVQIFDFGAADGVPCYSMELVEAGSLKQRLDDGPLDARAAAELMETIARAVHFAHESGIVHRDLKPANILLTADGEPKVSDFGLAKRLDNAERYTRTGEVLGTIGFMAPEQIDRAVGETDARTDVFALGAMLYQMLCGQSPFSSRLAQTLHEVLHVESKPPSRNQGNVSRDLDAVCLKCLEKSPARRYASAAEFADDLRRYLDARPVAARQMGPAGRAQRWMRRRPLVVIAVSLLLLVAAGMVAAFPIASAYRDYRERERLRARAVEVAPQVREILSRNCHECHGADEHDVKKDLNVLDHGLLLDRERRIVVPGEADESRLIQRIADGSMPPEEDELRLPRLSQQELTILNEWIAGGAPPFGAAESSPAPVVEFSPEAAAAKRVFIDRCYECHKYDVARGGIKILHHRLLLHVRRVVVPGKPDESELFQLITSDDEDSMMPPKEYPRLSSDEIETIRRWIEDGAKPFPKG